MAFSLPELNSLRIMGGKWKNHSSVITNHYCPLVLIKAVSKPRVYAFIKQQLHD